MKIKTSKICYSLLIIFLLFSSCKKNDIQHNNEIILENSFEENIVEEKKSVDCVLSPEEVEKQQYENAILEFIDSMSLEEQIGQMFLVTIGGTDFSDLHFQSDNYIAPGGYLFFTYNFENPTQGIKFTSEIQNWYAENSLIKPFFSIDQEGGLVNRLRDVASPLPSAKSIGKFLSPELCDTIYDLAARQLWALGIHINLGPVIEVLTEENEKFLDTRSFGDIEKVYEYSMIFINSMLDNKIFPVVKHFPGNNADDPHFGLPIIDFDINKTQELLISPFEKIDSKKDVGVLVAHSVVPSLFLEEEPIPSCLSKTVVTDILKNQLGYNGLVFSDDLLMAALQNNGYDSNTSISMAIKAGVNVLMIAQQEYMPFIGEILKNALEDVELKNQIYDSVYKIIDFKIQYGLLDYSNGMVKKQNPLSDEEILEFQNTRYDEFIKAFNEGEAFYHNYWG